MKNLTREEVAYMAKISLKLQRYEDMKILLKRLLTEDTKLSSDEINLFCIAYKHILSSKRSNYRVLVAQYELERKHKRIKKQMLLEPRLDLVRKEIESNCKEIITVLKKFLEDNPVTTKIELIYLKMYADFHRYLAETSIGDELEKAKKAALVIYQECYDKSKKDLPKVDPVRLGIALSFSTLYSDILEEPNQACLVAKRAFQEALTELDTLFENEYSDEEFNEVIIMIQVSGIRERSFIPKAVGALRSLYAILYYLYVFINFLLYLCVIFFCYLLIYMLVFLLQNEEECLLTGPKVINGNTLINFLCKG